MDVVSASTDQLEDGDGNRNPNPEAAADATPDPLSSPASSPEQVHSQTQGPADPPAFPINWVRAPRDHEIEDMPGFLYFDIQNGHRVAIFEERTLSHCHIQCRHIGGAPGSCCTIGVCPRNLSCERLLWRRSPQKSLHCEVALEVIVPRRLQLRAPLCEKQYWRRLSREGFRERISSHRIRIHLIELERLSYGVTGRMSWAVERARQWHS